MFKRFIGKIGALASRLNKPTALEAIQGHPTLEDLRPKVYRTGPHNKRYDSFLFNEVWIKSEKAPYQKPVEN